jgi:hypothetical protein
LSPNPLENALSANSTLAVTEVTESSLFKERGEISIPSKNTREAKLKNLHDMKDFSGDIGIPDSSASSK